MMKSWINSTVWFVGLSCAALFAAEPTEPKAELKKVLSVDDVSVKQVEGQPAKLKVTAAGMVSSGGWTEPALRQVKDNAAAGTLVFEFVARPPTGMATQALVEVKASITVDKPANYKEVLVQAQQNKKSAK